MHHASDFGYSIAGQLPSSGDGDTVRSDFEVNFETMISVDGGEPITVLDFYNVNEFTQDEIDTFEADLGQDGEAAFEGGAGPLIIVRLVQSAA